MVLSKEANLVDGHVSLKSIAGFSDCVPMAHSKELNKLVYACTPESIVIVSTDTGRVDAIDAAMSDEQSFVHRQGDGLFLYFPGGADRLAIREGDVQAKRIFDRSIVVEPGFTYSSIYLNPRALAAAPSISVPTITLEGDANGAPHADPKTYAQRFTGKHQHRTLTGGIGHNLPQEAPQDFAQAVLDVATG